MKKIKRKPLQDPTLSYTHCIQSIKKVPLSEAMKHPNSDSNFKNVKRSDSKISTPRAIPRSAKTVKSGD